MGDKAIRGLGTALALLALAAPAVVVKAQSNDYGMEWWTVDGGGGKSTSADGTYTLQGTIGQPDAGTSRSSEDTYAVSGGFWGGAAGAAAEYDIFLPAVLRTYS
jgi:hypothetical protein